MKLPDYIVSLHEQGTAEWLQDRAGNLNGSEVAAIFAKIKTGEAAARRDLRLKLVLEIVTGKCAPQGFVSDDMRWGIEHEAEALTKFESATGLLTERLGYCRIPGHRLGCSLDARFEDMDKRKGIVELKCPKSATHLRYLEEAVLPTDYVPQVTHNVWISGADYGYFQSYDPRFPESMQTFRILMRRSDLDIAGHAAACMQFLQEVERDVCAMEKRFGIKRLIGV